MNKSLWLTLPEAFSRAVEACADLSGDEFLEEMDERTARGDLRASGVEIGGGFQRHAPTHRHQVSTDRVEIPKLAMADFRFVFDGIEPHPGCAIRRDRMIRLFDRISGWREILLYGDDFERWLAQKAKSCPKRRGPKPVKFAQAMKEIEAKGPKAVNSMKFVEMGVVFRVSPDTCRRALKKLGPPFLSERKPGAWRQNTSS